MSAMEGNTTMAAMPEALGSSGWLSTNMFIAFAAVLAGSASMWIVQFIQYRLSYKKLGPALKQPPFTLLFGNLKAMASVYVNCPTDTHPSCSMTVMQRKFNLGNLWFMDNWPAASERQLVITDPVIAGELLQTQCIPKHPVLRQFVEHLCGRTSILFGPADATWKRNRALFNPGFSLGQLMTQIPTIIDDTMVFCDIMGEIADSGKIFQMEEPAARVTLDIMGHIVLDHDLNAQRTENELVTAFRSSVEWTPSAVSTNPFVGLHPLRPFMHRLYAWRMDNYIEKILDARYATGNRASSSKKGRRPAIDLALDEYALQQEESNVGEKSRGMDKHFKRVVMDQMKTFLFAGHDTSASTLCYTYHLLSIHPEALAKVRKEHDDVFGKGTTYRETGEMFKQEPTLANKLIFTLSVIKETLRLFPPASPAREGSAENSFTYDGVTYSTKDMMVFLPTHTLHRRADLFPSPDEFIPERFMPAPHNFQEVPKDAWRPFEKGLRACIGQELALLEMKIILAMTLRHFEVKAEYEEWDRMHGREKPGDILDGRRGICGERAYQVLLASAKPADGLPARVTRL